jgi:dienelactone hydrolase
MMDIKGPVNAYQLDVAPRQALVDEPVSIRVLQAEPGQKLTIRASTIDELDKRWQSYAVFTAYEQGVVDVGRQKPEAGSYGGVDSMGLFWSMRRVEKGKLRDAFFAKNTAAPLTVTIEVEVDGTTITTSSIERLFATAGVTAIEVREQGLVGTLFMPPGEGPRATIITLNGSDGGKRDSTAALLASHGYAVLALAYFKGASRKLEGVPAALINIPLEYFEKAIGWLQERKDVDSEKLAVIGHSRGGELALLLGATFPAIKAVVAGSPSGFVHGGIKYAPTSLPSWTYHGEALPYIPYKSTFKERMGFFKNFITRTPMTMREGFLKRMPGERMAENVTIPVEKTQGPILLIAGKDDQLWPSDIYCEQVMERLSAQKFGYSYERLSYEGAGHFLCFPYGVPSLPPMTKLSPGGGVTIDFGGNPRANAEATVDSWGRILGFLEEWWGGDAIDRVPSASP